MELELEPDWSGIKKGARRNAFFKALNDFALAKYQEFSKEKVDETKRRAFEDNLSSIRPLSGAGRIEVASFVDAVVEYDPKVPFAELVVEEIKQKYPRLLGLKIYASKEPGLPVLVGDLNGAGLGAAGTKYEADVIERGAIYYLKDGHAVEVTLPLRDRNGDVAAALKTRMASFPGETEDTAVARATLIKKTIEQKMATLEGTLE